MIASRIRSVLWLAALTTVGVMACDDPTTIEAHLEVEGFALFDGTTEIYRYTLDDGTPAPTLSLETGTHEVIFALLDHDGGFIIEDEQEDEEHELRITIEDTGVLTWTPEVDTGTAPHDFVEFRGQLEGLQAGVTTMTVCVPHEGHCDFTVAVPVTVTAPL
jgi:hypothetical protein